MKLRLPALAATLIAASTLSAHAQTAGTWSARAGVTHIAPDVTSGYLSAPSPPGHPDRRG